MKDGQAVYSDGRKEKIPFGIEDIDLDVYQNYEDIESIILPDSVKEISRLYFSGDFCDGISVKEIYIPESVQTIGEYAFSGCTSIKEIDFTNLTLNVYETGVFKGCTALTKVNVNKVNGVIFKIGAFNGCSLLEADGVLNNGAEFNFDGINPDVFDFDLPIKV